jgi:hypothetical protein
MSSMMLLYRFCIAVVLILLFAGVSWVILLHPTGSNQDDKLVYALLTGVIAVMANSSPMIVPNPPDGDKS